jgi:hypothetical protein
MIANKIGAFAGLSGGTVEKITAVVEVEPHAALF